MTNNYLSNYIDATMQLVISNVVNMDSKININNTNLEKNFVEKKFGNLYRSKYCNIKTLSYYLFIIYPIERIFN